MTTKETELRQFANQLTTMMEWLEVPDNTKTIHWSDISALRSKTKMLDRIVYDLDFKRQMEQEESKI